MESNKHENVFSFKTYCGFDIIFAIKKSATKIIRNKRHGLTKKIRKIKWTYFKKIEPHKMLCDIMT